MAKWVKLCTAAEAPLAEQVGEFTAEGVDVCLAHHEGEFFALNNWCPHKKAPLGQGWLEGDAVLCPKHAWAFDLHTGKVHKPEKGRVETYPTKVVDGDVFVQIEL